MTPTDHNLAAFRRILLEWWSENARDFPWRHHRTPYRTAIAELMLRRTRAEQVARIYTEFLTDYPTLESAAEAPPDEVRPKLYGLGLNWRTENTIEFVKEARIRYGEQLPSGVEELKQLPGIGDYVASAVACFAGGESVPIIDTNVVRVLGRVFGLDIRGEARRRKPIRDLAAKAVDPDRPADYHYAILDFAAKVCTARKPACSTCPLSAQRLCDYATSNNK